MQVKELRAMSVDELREQEDEVRGDLARLNMQRYARRLDKTSELGVKKRDLARLLTVLAEKRRAGDEGASK